MNHTMHEQYDPSELAKCLDKEAKWYWGATYVLSVFVFFTGTLGTFLTSYAAFASIISVSAALVLFLFDQLSDVSKGKASELRRRIDLKDSFGWPMDNAEYSDLILHCSRSVKNKARGRSSTESYFASTEPLGSARGLQNVRESAWWSEHLAKKMFLYTASLTGLLAFVVFIVFLALLTTLNSQFIGNADIYTKLSSSFAAFFMLAVTTNLAKNSVGYSRFAKGAAKTKDLANSLLQQPPIRDDRAIVCIYEYFIIRNENPLLPTWLWESLRDELNDQYPYKSHT